MSARFRDRKVAASLKPANTTWSQILDYAFPRSKGRGLIEAIHAVFLARR